MHALTNQRTAVQTAFQAVKPKAEALSWPLVGLLSRPIHDKIGPAARRCQLAANKQVTANQPRQHGLQMTIAHEASDELIPRIHWGALAITNHRTINKRDDYTLRVQGLRVVLGQYASLPTNDDVYLIQTGEQKSPGPGSDPTAG